MVHYITVVIVLSTVDLFNFVDINFHGFREKNAFSWIRKFMDSHLKDKINNLQKWKKKLSLTGMISVVT